MKLRICGLYTVMLGLLAVVGFVQSWSLSLSILNLCLISAIMTLGVNLQWGLAGQLNAGVMGSAALGGLAVVIVSQPPVTETLNAAGWGIFGAVFTLCLSIAICVWVWRVWQPRYRIFITTAIALTGLVVYRLIFDPAVARVEAIDAATTGYLGGLGLPVILSWGVGGGLAALAAWGIGRISLGLRSDYFAIATFGIAEIIIYIIKNEEWLTRGVKNITGLKRPVPYEVDLQESQAFIEFASFWNAPLIDLSIITVKLTYAGLFVLVLIILLWLSEKALRSPWGRMMRAIRDNEVAAAAMGKNVKARHLQVFVLGSAIIGIAGAMLVTLEGQYTPASYQPLRFTFLIGVMAIVGGSGNNFGSVLGGFLIWFLWIEAEPAGFWLIDTLTQTLPETDPLRTHLLESSAHMRYIIMGVILLLVLKFYPKGLIPERQATSSKKL